MHSSGTGTLVARKYGFSIDDRRNLQPCAFMLAKRFIHVKVRLLHIRGNMSPRSLRGPPGNIGSLYCKLQALNPPVSVAFSPRSSPPLISREVPFLFGSIHDLAQELAPRLRRLRGIPGFTGHCLFKLRRNSLWWLPRN